MPQEPLRPVVDYLHKVSAAQEMHNWADSRLLELYVDERAEAAFTALVRRHGPMVLGVCRRVLGDDPSADDAFQATFMVLVRRVAAVQRHKPLDNWLYGVAQRVALKARAKAVARQSRQRALKDIPCPEPIDEKSWQELRGVLDEEIGGLPAKYRAPIVLCYFQGKSHEQAAQDLGWPRTSLTNRLSRACDLLRSQLTGRGITLSAGALTTVLMEKTAPSALGGMLAINTTKAAMSFATGATAAGVAVSAQSLALAESTVKGMVAMKVKLVLMMLAIGLAIGGAGVAGYHGMGGFNPSDAETREHARIAEEPRKQASEKIVAEQTKPKDQPERLDINGDPLPGGAMARIGQDRWLHELQALFAAFLPDGKSVVTLTGDMTIRVWEYPSGNEIRRITVAKDFATGSRPALTKDGKTFAVCFSSQMALDPLNVLNLFVKDPLAPPPSNPVEIYFFDIATGKQLARLKNEGGVTSMAGVALAFSPNGEHLAVRANDGNVRIWDWANAKEVCSIPAVGRTGYYSRHLAYSPDGKLIATATQLLTDKRFGPGNAGAGYSVKLWDALTGKEMRTIPATESQTNPISVAFSPDNKTLAVSRSEAITLVDLATGKETAKLTLPPLFKGQVGARDVIFSKNGAKLYTCFASDQIMEWDISSGKVVRECKAPTLTGSSYLSLSPDGNTLLLASFGPQFFDLSAGKDITSIIPRTSPVVSVHFLPDRKHLLTHSGENSLTHSGDSGFDEVQSVRKWDVATGKDLGLLNVKLPANPGNPTIFSPDCRVGVTVAAVNHPIFSADEVPKVRTAVLFDTASGKQLAEISLEAERTPRHRKPIVFSPNGSMLAIGAGVDRERIDLYEVPSGKLLRTLDTGPIDPQLSGMQFAYTFPFEYSPKLFFSPDGKTLATYTSSDWKTLVLWDTSSGRRIGSIPLSNGIPNANAAFSLDGRCLALDINEGSVVIFELATGQRRSNFGKSVPPPKTSGLRAPLGASLGMVPDSTAETRSCFAFSPDGRILAQGDFKGMVHLWDIVTGKKLETFAGHAGALNAVAFSTDDKSLATAGNDGTALIWDLSKIERAALTPKALKPADLETLWRILAGNDAAKALNAICDLASAPKDVVPFLKSRLRPASPLDLKHTDELIKQLDSDQFKVRDNASAELLEIGERIIPALDKSLEANPPLESKQRLEKLRGELIGMILQGERLRTYRAIEVLDLIGTPEARQALQTLAQGAPGALVTVSAQAALKR